MGVGVRVSKWLFFMWVLFPLLTVKGRAQLGPAGEVDLLDDDCECLPFYQCNNKYGKDVIGLRQSSCEKPEDVCCPYEIEPTPAVPTHITPLIKNECGIRNFDGIGFKVLSGEETMLGEFPWMIAIMSEKDGGEKFECGGSLIHPQVVLTAAHCIDLINEGDLIARGGAWDYRTNEQIRPQQNRKIQSVIIHEEYERDTALHDIALLILKEPFAEAENLGIICLPTQEKIIYEDCIVTGWGKNETDGVLQDSLRLLEVPIVPRDQCQALLRKTRLGKKFKLHGSFICAGGVGADSCEGDGGGPLICPIKGGKDMQYQQIGIVSWGIDCGVAPGVYVNVMLFVDWINKQMNTVGFKPSF